MFFTYNYYWIIYDYDSTFQQLLQIYKFRRDGPTTYDTTYNKTYDTTYNTTYETDYNTTYETD